MRIRLFGVLGACLPGACFLGACLLTGCVTTGTDVVSLQARPKQEFVTREGARLLASRQPNSVVVLRTTANEFSGEARPTFFLGIENISKRPVDFRLANVSAMVTSPQRQALKVFSYDELVAEAHDRNADEALTSLVLAGAADKASRDTAGKLDILGNLGADGASTQSKQVRSSAAAGNSIMVGGAVLEGMERLDELGQTALKDGRLMPGQWHGGQVHVERPSAEGRRTYTLVVVVGPDRHEFDVVQQTASQ